MKTDDLNKNLFLIRMTGLLLGGLLLIGGMVMIFMDFQSAGTLTVKTPLFSGSINATYIGLLVIFLGVLLGTVALLRSHKFKQTVEVTKKPDKATVKANGRTFLLSAQKLLLDAPPLTESDIRKIVARELPQLGQAETSEMMELLLPATLTEPQLLNIFALLGQETSRIESSQGEVVTYKSETSGSRLSSGR